MATPGSSEPSSVLGRPESRKSVSSLLFLPPLQRKKDLRLSIVFASPLLRKTIWSTWSSRSSAVAPQALAVSVAFKNFGAEYRQEPDRRRSLDAPRFSSPAPRKARGVSRSKSPMGQPSTYDLFDALRPSEFERRGSWFAESSEPPISFCSRS
jgi:hypothetical protein